MSEITEKELKINLKSNLYIPILSDKKLNHDAINRQLNQANAKENYILGHTFKGIHHLWLKIPFQTYHSIKEFAQSPLGELYYNWCGEVGHQYFELQINKHQINQIDKVIKKAINDKLGLNIVNGLAIWTAYENHQITCDLNNGILTFDTELIPEQNEFLKAIEKIYC